MSHFLAVAPLWLWITFSIMVTVMMALDLGVFHRHAKAIKATEAAIWFFIWVGVALAFNVFIQARMGTESALEFLTGYLIEQSLSVDNIFVFVVIFAYFGVPAQ